MGNQALSVNPTGSLTIFNLTTNGSNWLWSVFSLMGFSTILIALLSLRRPSYDRTFHLFNISVLTATSIAYFCMASNLGSTPVQVLQRGPGARQFWYVRYVEWAVTTPLLLAQLLLIAGLPKQIILASMFADVMMIVCGLIGGLVSSTYKWAFYVFGCVIMFGIFWNIISGIKLAGEYGGASHRRTYIILTVWMLFFWMIYPVAWGLCEGSNTIPVTGEMIFYGILDIFSKPLFAALILFLSRNLIIPSRQHQTRLRVERLNYLPKSHENIEHISTTTYQVGSPDVIRTHY